jgi:acetoacetate decarboxylase
MKTRWLRPPEELPDLQARLAAPRFLDSSVLSVTFETDPALIAALLPHPLEHDGSGIATVFVGRWGRSNCVGPFAGGALNLRANYGTLSGVYCLTMPMSTDAAVIFGRELYGEPKKMARVTLERTGAHVSAAIERHGITYIAIEAELSERDADPGEARGLTFHLKATPRADGHGFDAAPLLVGVSSRTRLRLVERGTARLVFADSPFDPVADFPVRRVLSATYSEGDTETTAQVLAALDPTAALPYYLGRLDPLDGWDAATGIPALEEQR